MQRNKYTMLTNILLSSLRLLVVLITNMIKKTEINIFTHIPSTGELPTSDCI